MPRTGPPTTADLMKDLLEDGLSHLEDAVHCLGGVATHIEDVEGPRLGDQWKAVVQELEALRERVKKLTDK